MAAQGLMRLGHGRSSYHVRPVFMDESDDLEGHGYGLLCTDGLATA